MGPFPGNWLATRIADLTPDLQVFLSWGSSVVSFHSRQSFSVSFFHVSLGLPVYKTIKIIYNLECSFQVWTLPPCAPYLVSISTSSLIVDGVSCKKLTECLVFMARKHADVIEKRLLYSQNMFCYFLWHWCVLNHKEIVLFSSVVWGNLESCSEPRKNFLTQSNAEKYEVFLCTLSHGIWLCITKVMKDFPYLWCLWLLVLNVREPNQADHVIGHLA